MPNKFYLLLSLVGLIFIFFLIGYLITYRNSTSNQQQSDKTTSWWVPPPISSFQWQITDEPIDQSVAAEIFDIDLFNNDKTVISSLHNRGKKVICYINVGTWENFRQDKDDFPKEVLGKSYNKFEDERWLDIRRIEIIGPIIKKRFDTCRDKGFDSVEPDNLDGYLVDTGFTITLQDQLKYNKWLANEAHKRGLSIGLKNNPDLANELEPFFDWALTEDCFIQGWCEKMSIFTKKGKAVFTTEYTDTGAQLDQFCPKAQTLKFNAILKNRNLDAFREICK